jgi:type IV secretion system protein VirB5
MNTRIGSIAALALLLGPCFSIPGHAQIPVTDIGAITQLITQAITLKNQLETAKAQLLEAENTYKAFTGGRGMEKLLTGVVRNYLPPDFAELERALTDTGSSFGALAAEIQGLIRGNAILTDADLTRLSPVQRQLMLDGRRNAAGLAAVSRSALANSSARFASLQGLINAIPTATDAKAIADLQARIQSETTLLQNENTKLQALYQVEAAQGLLRSQRLREQSIAETGNLRDLPAMGLATRR